MDTIIAGVYVGVGAGKVTCPTCGAPALASFPAGTLYACQGAHGLGVAVLAADIEKVKRAEFKRGAEAMRAALLWRFERHPWANDVMRCVPEPEFVEVGK